MYSLWGAFAAVIFALLGFDCAASSLGDGASGLVSRFDPNQKMRHVGVRKMRDGSCCSLQVNFRHCSELLRALRLC